MHEEDIEDWYFNHQEAATFQQFLCREKALRNKDSSCLVEETSSNKVKGEKGQVKEELWERHPIC